jgi:hypothetical protein
MLVGGLGFELSCTTMTTHEGAIETNADAQGVLLFTKCTTLSIPKLPEEIHCHVKEPIRAEALFLPTELTNGAAAILAEKIKALITLHLPEVKLGETPCILPLDILLTGEVCLAIDNNDTAEPTVLTSASIECKVKTALDGGTEGSGSVKDLLKYGINIVTLDGTAKLFLTGAHNGLALGVSLY